MERRKQAHKRVILDRGFKIMTINIRNDKGESIAFIKIIDGFIVEEELKGCFVSKLYGCDKDGGLEYRLDISPSEELIESLSNETLLNEIRNRMQ